MDGLSFTLDSDGLPRPTGDDGAPTDGSLEILALGLACNAGMRGDQRLIAVRFPLIVTALRLFYDSSYGCFASDLGLLLMNR